MTSGAKPLPCSVETLSFLERIYVCLPVPDDEHTCMIPGDERLYLRVFATALLFLMPIHELEFARGKGGERRRTARELAIIRVDARLIPCIVPVPAPIHPLRTSPLIRYRRASER